MKGVRSDRVGFGLGRVGRSGAGNHRGRGTARTHAMDIAAPPWGCGRQHLAGETGTNASRRDCCRDDWRAYCRDGTSGVPAEYDGAGHGFNCDIRASYHEEGAKLAQERTNAFLEEHMGNLG